MTADPPVPLPPLTRVAVVGAGGPSGLVAVAQLLAAGVPPAAILAYEARTTAGGVWNYEAEPGPMRVDWRKSGPPVVRAEAERKASGANGPSAMYDKLRTNLPNKIMNYRQSPFPKGTPTFPTHGQVVAYLQHYAKEHELDKVITWATRVTDVYHTPNGADADRWTVETQNVTTGDKSVEHVSHVIISNGHYNEPYLPPIPGLHTFTGELVHSRWWRNARRFRGQNVVVVGSRASGSDIARELAMDDEDMETSANGTISAQRAVYQSVRNFSPTTAYWDDECAWARRIRVVPEIVSVHDRTLLLEDGSTLEGVDAIVFATGYLYSYPFLNRAPFDEFPLTTSLAPAGDGLPRAGGQDILNLNASDTFYVPDPTLALIGLHYQVNPFPLGEASARLIARSFVNGLIPALPPLLRASDYPGDIKIGAPNEFDNQDAWLLAIGEGGEDGGRPGGWPKSSEETRQARINALTTRKAELGY